jgi:hypothetical protein
MVDKVNGNVRAGETLGRNLDFFVFTSPVNILPLAASGNTTSQAALNKLVEVISLRGQPIILGTPYLDGSDYVVKFATEHTGAWTAVTLEAAVLEHAPVHFATANAATMSVTLASNL